MIQINKQLLTENFTKICNGYHLLHKDPINETNWESVNEQTLDLSGYEVLETSSGSHKPGCDITTNTLGGLSNKSTQYGKDMKGFSVSSYRLTSICSQDDPGDINTIIETINKKKNFDFYSILVRNETSDQIQYDWYLIPSNNPIFNPESYSWEPLIGQRGKNMGKQIGWKSNEINGSSMDITFSMSSQLWIYVEITDELKDYIVSSCTVKKTDNKKINYSQIFEAYSK